MEKLLGCKKSILDGTEHKFSMAQGSLDIPEELEEYFAVSTENIGSEQITNMLNSIKESYQNPDKFIVENKEMLQRSYQE